MEADTAALKQPSGPGESGWQARKSAATRSQIISAAIRCIVESSYSKTTMMKISEKAGLSRGATLHHFPSKMDIIRAAVDYIHEKRIQAFRRSIKEIPEGAGTILLTEAEAMVNGGYREILRLPDHHNL